jgi:Zn-dependent protease with chaperone function
MAHDFDFQRFVDQQKSPGQATQAGERGNAGRFADYAFSGDLRVLRQLDRLKPVRMVAESTVRFWKTMQRNELLGHCVKVSRRQFPELYDTTAECARRLGIPMPTVYVTQSPEINASTFGTDEEAFIILNSALVDMFEPNELHFVIGHECGHLHNNHVVYHTAANFLARGLGLYIKWAIAPASLALNSWSRRGEITCDRAGLVCCMDEQAATNAMLKLALGSVKLFEKVELDEYLKQADSLRVGVGRFHEYLQSHPYLPKRIQALQLFAQSSYYRSLIHERDGRPLDEIDREVEAIVQVY